MSHEKVTDKLQGNYLGSVNPKGLNRKPEQVGSDRTTPHTPNHTGSMLNRKLRSKLKQSYHYLSYSAPPGVSWPLSNFLVNYTARCHLWSIMTLSPSALCFWDTKANLYRSYQSVSKAFNVRRLKVDIRISPSQPFKMYLPKKQRVPAFEMSKNIQSKLKTPSISPCSAK